jgi:predicted dehydrogenase
MVSKEKIKVGIAGCGVVATAYYLPYLLQMENVEMTAVCDLYPERTAACVRLFVAQSEYLDYDEMIGKEDLDAVFILTGPGPHVDFSLKALDAGIHVLIQKPMALDLESAQKIARKTRETGQVVLVEPSACTQLEPDVATLRSLIDKGVLGKPYWFSFFDSRFTTYHPSLGGNPYGMSAFYSEDSGGVLFDYPYAPSLIVSLLGPCKSVTGKARLSIPERSLVPEKEYNKFLVAATDPMHVNYWDVVLDLPKTEQITMGAPDNVFSIYEMVSGF